MTTFSRQFVAALALAFTQAGVVPAQDETKPEAAVPTKPTRAELRDKQLDVSLEARDIERILSKLKKASELSKQRITEAAKTAESASTSLDKGDSKAARVEAQQTAEMFQEIAKQLEALLKEDAPQQIAEARQLAQQLAKAEREFAEKFQGALNPVQATGQTKMKIDPRSQVKPLVDPDMKGQGGQNKTEAQGKNGGGEKADEKKEDDKNTEKNDPDGKNSDDKNGEKKESNTGDADQPGDKGNEPRDDGKKAGDKPMPDGQGAGKTQDKKDKAKLDTGDKPDGGSSKEPGDKPTDGGAGKDKDETKDGDEQKPGGAGSAKKKDDGKIGEDQDGFGGDKPSDKKRDGSGDGSDKDQMNDKDRNGGGAALTAEQRREMVAERANQLAESGRTLQDVLNVIAKSTEPGDKEAVAKIQEVIKEIDIDKLVGEMSQVANMIRSSKDDDAKLSSLDVAERLEIMAQRLDGAYRVIVAPQAEELRKIEQALADLRDQLEKLETPSQVAAWHREVRDLLDKLDKLGVSPKDREYLEKEMAKAGFGLDMDRTKRGGALNWDLVNGYYAYPVAYNHALIHLQEDIQERIQTLILGDLGNASDEATPPKYQELVERYYEVLSRSGKPAAARKSESGAIKKAK